MRQSSSPAGDGSIRKALNRLFATAGSALALSVPVALLAQVAINTARIAPPSDAFEAQSANNEALDNDALFAVIIATNDSAGPVNSANGASNIVNILTNDLLNGTATTSANVAITVTSPASDPGVTLNLANGDVSVAAGTPAGTYSIGYQICEKINPTNCANAIATIEVVAARSDLSGIVFDDANQDGLRQSSETLRSGWIVEIMRNGVVVATTVTDATGAYSVTGLLSGYGYAVRFINPENRVVYGIIPNVTLANNVSLPNQNWPLDPSGVVYNSVTRAPISGVRAILTDRNGQPLPVICYLDSSQSGQTTGISGAYRFDIIPGADPACPSNRTEYRILLTPPPGFALPASTILPSETGSFSPAGRTGTVAIVPQPTAPQGSDPTIYYLSFSLAQGDSDVVHNHIPLDPFLTRLPLIMTKTSLRRSASVGDLVPYTITIRNTEQVQRANVNIVDILPPGFKYVPQSATANEVAAEPVINDREVAWNKQIIPANASVIYRLTLVVGAGVTGGDRINNALARNGADGSDISNRGQAVVAVVPSNIFDCSEIIGKVFDDLNGDGYQNDGEPGMAAVRLATVNGQLVTTDQYGRYHITCAAVPDARIGSNFVLKLDSNSLPSGYVVTSGNPQSIRLTRGKIVELNFGIHKAIVRVDADYRALSAKGSGLRSDFEAGLMKLLLGPAQRPGNDGTQRAIHPSTISIVYSAGAQESEGEAAANAERVRQGIASILGQIDQRPVPLIEVSVRHASAAAAQEQ